VEVKRDAGEKEERSKVKGFSVLLLLFSNFRLSKSILPVLLSCEVESGNPCCGCRC